MARKRILVIEDDEDVTRVLKALLSGLHADVSTAPDGVAAIAAACKAPPSLCLVDLHLPKINGLDVIRVLKSMPGLHEVPVIIITGNTTADYIREAVNLGVSDFLVKANFLAGSCMDRIRKFLDSAPLPGPATKRRDDRLKVLVVDDDEDVRAQLVARLADLGVRVLPTGDGLEAVALAAAEQPGLLVVDLELPRMKGLDVIRVVKDLHQANPPAVVVVTGYATREAVKRAKELGVLGLISKDELDTPATSKRLKAAVEEARMRSPASAKRA
jgi:CheY-like chemotaxis protein